MPAPDPDSGEVVYSRMRWNTPLSETHADLLLDRLALRSAGDVLDLGCGWGELLLRAVSRTPEGRGTGVDQARWAARRGATQAAAVGLTQRIRWVDGDAAAWADRADRVLCIGASHAWGGGGEALQALRRVVRPGGLLLFGDGYWERPPTPDAVAVLGDGIPVLGDLVDQAIGAGWRVLHLTTADQREWDEFESAWRAGREDWLASHPDDPRAGEVAARLDERLREYVKGYRSLLGFAYLVLAAPNRTGNRTGDRTGSGEA